MTVKEVNSAAMHKIAKLSDTALIEQWELTSKMPISQNLATVRGWLMLELEKRFPIGFDAWMQQDAPEDLDLRFFVRREMKRRRNNEHQLA